MATGRTMTEVIKDYNKKYQEILSQYMMDNNISGEDMNDYVTEDKVFFHINHMFERKYSIEALCLVKTGKMY